MILRKIFKARELGLTDDEEMYLCERCEGSPSSCFEILKIFCPEDAIDEYEDDEIMISVNQKLLNTGLVEIGEIVMIDLCW